MEGSNWQSHDLLQPNKVVEQVGGHAAVVGTIWRSQTVFD